jgi:hypothetical protein
MNPELSRRAEERDKLQIAFDPHPNERGTEAQANAVLEAIR